MRGLAVVVGIALALRLPFLDQAIQGDDPYYLAAAQHAQIDPLHPHQARYVFLGEMVDMRGFPHPPGNAWTLAALLAILGDVREIPFHAAYAAFSVIAAVAVWSLARRFSTRPLWAALLFLATPAFVVNGNSLESDVPFVALWLASFALWVRAVDHRSVAALAAAVAALAAASMFAFQAVVAVPILALYLCRQARDWRPAWAAVLAPLAVIGLWQAWERATGGELPAAVLTGYFSTYGLQSLANKLRNAAALAVHLTWIVSPLLLIGLAVRRARPSREESWLIAWVLIFFAAALVFFFAGSARYLLPIAAPVAILVANRLDARWLAAGFVLHLALGFALATVNYQHWGGYRDFVRSLAAEFASRRVWINGELGMRFYAESEGGLPLVRGQAVRPGELVLSSAFAFPIPYTTGGGVATPAARREIRPALPLRMIGLGVRSAYSTATLGLRPFDVVAGPVDIVTAHVIVERAPSLSWLPMNAPEAESQIVSGIHQLEAGAWRWMSGRAVILLKSPAAPAPVRVDLHLPAQSPARRAKMFLDGALIADKPLAPGTQSIESPPVASAAPSVALAIELDRAFRAAGDHRELGATLSGAGFKP
jgi:4-amino-4-deoxy-L-arabinose transferase-like glycosyltransferase